MEEALVSLLLNDSGLTSRVDNRVYWARRPQDVSALPVITLFRVSAPRDYHMQGASGLVESRVQCDLFGAKYSETKLSARALMAAINGYSGTFSGTQFQRISIENERDTNETESDAGRHLFRTSIDLLIWHDE